MNNYTIKKMLPRLIIAALLVNMSYWICALAVDLSNILGYSLKSLIDGASGASLTMPDWPTMWASVITGAGLGAVAAGISIAGAAATATMGIGLVWLVLPLLIVAVISVLTAMFVLIIRQALVIILIVLSPLAFVAFLLPNTEKWFNKWRELFFTMLVFFPIFSIIFGGATLAMNLLVTAASSVGKTDPLRGGILMLSGLTVQFLVLFTAPFAVKFSGNLVGGIAGKFQGGLTKMSAPLNKLSKDKLELSQKANMVKYSGDKNYGRFGNAVRRFQNYRRLDKARGAKSDAQMSQLDSEWLAKDSEGIALNNDTLAANNAAAVAKTVQNANFYGAVEIDPRLMGNAMGMGDDEKLKAAVAAQKNKEAREAVDNIKSQVSSDSIAELGKKLSEALAHSDHHAALAIQETLSGKGGAGIAELGNAVSRAQAIDPGGVSSYMASAQGESFRNSLMSTPNLKGTDAATLEWAKAGGAGSLDTVRATASTYGGLKLEDIISQSGSRAQYDSAGVVVGTASNQGSVVRAQVKTKDQAKAILKDKDAVKKLEPDTITYLRSIT